MESRLFEASEVEQEGLHIELLAQPAVSYASVANGTPLVRKVTLTNRSTLSVFDLSLELRLVGPEGELATPWRVLPVPPVPPGRAVSWEEFGSFAPDVDGLLATQEGYPVEVQLAVTRPEGEPVRLVLGLRVLAHDEWLDHPALHDTLAAHVQPEASAVATVLDTAAGILLRHSGSGAIQGYQAGPARAAKTAGAIYEALRGVHGCAAGQRIRDPATVLREGQGSDLDLAVAYAACLERAGLCPLIWLLPTGVVGGFFLEAERLGAVTVTEANLLTSLTDAGRAVPVRLGQGLDFADAVRAGLAAVRRPEAQEFTVVDVSLAHRSGIRPMPAAAAGVQPLIVADGATAIDLPAGAAADRLVERAAETAEAVDERDPAPPRVRQWKRSLLDLSLRNPLLNLPSRGRGVDLRRGAASAPAAHELAGAAAVLATGLAARPRGVPARGRRGGPAGGRGGRAGADRATTGRTA